MKFSLLDSKISQSLEDANSSIIAREKIIEIIIDFGPSKVNFSIVGEITCITTSV